ncbi:hypothetical protein ACLB2K_048152 [Fragaria x ananassa]
MDSFMSQSDTMGYSSSTPSFPSSANAETTAGLHAAPLPPTAPSVPSSATEGTHEGSQSRKRKEPSNKSKMWQYFTRCKLPDGQIDPKYCTCNYCHERVLCLTEKNGTSSMLYHSKRCEKHPCYQKSKESDPTQTRLSRDNVSGGTGYRRWNKKRCDDKCIEMIIKDELPFRFVEREGFRALCNELEPQWTVLDRKQVAKGVLERFNTEKSMLLSQLKMSDTRILMKMYEEYKGCEGMEQAEQPLEDDLELDGVAYEDLDEVSKEIARERMSEQSQCIRNEVDQYLTDRHVSLTCKTFDVGKWWKGVETTYPILSKLAKDILAVPCSTVASENAFSLGSRVVDPFRASLTPKTVEALVCTSDWLRCAPANFNLYEPPTEDEMVIYHELEELERENAFTQNIEAGRGGPSSNSSGQTNA